jgi:methionyl-tRNA synthetase
LFSTFVEQQKNIEHKLSTHSFRDALFEVMDLARNGNKYLQETEPWKLIKTDEESVKIHIGIITGVLPVIG